MATDDPLECKKLAREIDNYNEHKWNQVAYDICEPGIHAKFTQNIKLTNLLITSGNKKLAEASKDDVWGTGFYLGHACCADPDKWINQGILGRMLSKLRAELQANNTTLTQALHNSVPLSHPDNEVPTSLATPTAKVANTPHYSAGKTSTPTSTPMPTPIADRLRSIANTVNPPPMPNALADTNT